MDDAAIVRAASRGADIAAAHATSVHHLMLQRIMQVHLQTISVRAAQTEARAAAADTSRRGQALLAPLASAVAGHHQMLLNELVDEVLRYGLSVGLRVPDDVIALAIPTTDSPSQPSAARRSVDSVFISEDGSGDG